MAGIVQPSESAAGIEVVSYTGVLCDVVYSFPCRDKGPEVDEKLRSVSTSIFDPWQPHPPPTLLTAGVCDSVLAEPGNRRKQLESSA